MKKEEFKIGDKFGAWTLSKYVDRGGNAQVWEAKNSSGESNAIKLIFPHRLNRLSFQRFKDEIEAVLENSENKGILPIIDHSLPDDFKKEKPWYVMPLAITLEEHITYNKLRANPVSILELLIFLAERLYELHTKNIYHRDIKPSNLFFYSDHPCFSDFGLVDFPGKDDVTGKCEAVGPKWTIAPEMKRDSINSDGAKADVYSFAKTIWILLTCQYKGFEGQYNASDEQISLNKFLKLDAIHMLENLLSKCTDNNPKKRPDMKEVAEGLKSFKKTINEFETINRENWKHVPNRLFPNNIPQRAIWTDMEDIISILNILADNKSLVHMFFPTAGGLHLESASVAYETDCIELNSSIIIKPKQLIFESFKFDPIISYFRLETSELESVIDKDDTDRMLEELTELSTGNYTDALCYEVNNYNGNDLPKDARRVGRQLKGSLVFFAISSLYNYDSSTYDARHNRMNDIEFRDYIKKNYAQPNLDMNHDNLKESNPKLSYTKSEYVLKGRKLTSEEIGLINNIIKMAQNARSKRDAIRVKHNFSGNTSLADPRYFEYLLETDGLDTELKCHLKSLPRDNVILIAAVMYGGREYKQRGRCASLDEGISSCKSDQHLIEMIIEKEPLDEYLSNGLIAYSK